MSHRRDWIWLAAHCFYKERILSATMTIVICVRERLKNAGRRTKVAEALQIRRL